MLDYAANAIVYWPVAELRAEFENSCVASGAIPEEQIHDRLAADLDPEVLWQRVETNLRAGRIRMLFVADHIPPELRRIVEFLNLQMDPAEVLALELRQFQGQGLKTIVPMLYGQTEEKKSASAPRQWDEASIYDDIEQRHGPDALKTGRTIVAWLKTKPGSISYGRGGKDGSIGLTVSVNDLKSTLMVLYTYGCVEIPFQWMKKPFDDPDKREELRKRLNQIDGINIPPDAISKRPSIRLSILSSNERLKNFLDVMDWCLAELRSA